MLNNNFLRILISNIDLIQKTIALNLQKDYQMTYIIGDVHGEFDSLRILADKFPKDSKLIFVGDLVDR
jgi:hypothetical protein